MRALFVLSVLTLAAGCGHPQTLTYDYGRAYEAAFAAQADLTRPSAKGLDYPLSGTEGIELRLRVQEETTDEESGRAETTAKTSVQ